MTEYQERNMPPPDFSIAPITMSEAMSAHRAMEPGVAPLRNRVPQRARKRIMSEDEKAMARETVALARKAWMGMSHEERSIRMLRKRYIKEETLKLMEEARVRADARLNETLAFMRNSPRDLYLE